MVTVTDEASTDDGLAVPGQRGTARRRRRRLRRAGIVLVVILAILAVIALTKPLGFDITQPFSGRQHARHGSGSDTATATTATVEKRTLTEQTSVNGTLGYAGSVTILGQLPGTVTWLPSAGDVIREGQRLYEADDKPVVLLYGTVPFYRDLAEGKTAADVADPDVRQLNRALVRLGYADDLGLDPTSDEFSWATKVAIERMQKALGLEQTGKLSRGQAVFLPEPVRVTKLSAQLGGSATGQIMTGTSTRRTVTVKLDVAQQEQVKAGGTVTITLPNGATTPGRISSVGKVASPGSDSSDSTTVPVVVTPTKPDSTGSWDQAPVQVAITTGTVRDATVVPVTALLALAGGGYAVEVVPTTGAHRLVPVELGSFDDRQGIVQVTGTELTPGTRVVVPAS